MSALPHRLRVLEVLAEHTRPVHVAEIAQRLGIEGTPGLTAMLDDLVFSGAVRAFPGHRYRIGDDVEVDPEAAAAESVRPPPPPGAPPAATPSEPPFSRRSPRERVGMITIHPRGFGFVASPGDRDVYVSPEMIGGALHGDQVTVRVFRSSARGPEGEVLSVVRRTARRVPGVLRRRGKSAWLEPDDPRMRGPITLDEANEGYDGQAAVIAITRYPERHDEHPRGALVQILGDPGDPEVEVLKILAREEIVEGFPGEAVAEARAFGEVIDPKVAAGREDLRKLPLATIDPKDARDHDDAVWVRPATAEDGDGAAWVAWIAIADVSSYVREGSALDDAARHRSCSVYLPDRAIPMLPRELSSHLCSLIAHEDRLCLAACVTLDASGTVLKRRLVQGVMRSVAKLTYEDVARALAFTSDEPASEQAKEMLPHLEVAWACASALRQKRMRRGALDFDLPEAKVVLDENGVCTDVVRARADLGVKKAYNLIEELMLLANEVVADELTQKGVPTIYRVHGRPDEAKLDRFAAMAEILGIRFDLEDAQDPRALGRLLKSIAKHPQAQVLNSLLLRSMKQATYDIVNIGHFGLASPAYLHFTSPIRRYPDLVVHRAVHRLCEGKPAEKSETAIESLREAAMLASDKERKVMEVEREVVDLHRCILMRDRIGESFEGTVTALVGSGVFVALDAPYVDVMVKYEALGDDAYDLDEDGLRAVGRRSGDAIHLGDRMIVRIEDVGLERRQVSGRRLAFASDGVDDGPGPRRRGSLPPPRGTPPRGKAPPRGASGATNRAGRPSVTPPRSEKPSKGGKPAHKGGKASPKGGKGKGGKRR
ncbi:MAG: ribonuclease R [Myxococcales bacterium]|nr:ribonuclease R [Myxococcales bacterium]